ncbi:MAG: hypothetical protein Q9P44_21945 [Anaerolineae bacterium]|nr:hypothetical protein [Anaerolineae bacterium]
MPNLQEARAEAITAGLLVIVIALFLLGGLADSLAMVAAGLVLLGSGLYQSSRGWHVAVTTWLLGIVLLFGGIGVRMFLVAYLQINWVAISLVLIGGVLIWQNIFRRNDKEK